MIENKENIEKWREEYKRLCCELLKMTALEARIHLATAVDFDYGYSPLFYVQEEMNVKFYEEHVK